MRKRWLIDAKGRQCRLCTIYKEWSEFTKNAGNSTGHSNACKYCDYRDPIKKEGRKRRRRRRLERDLGYKLRENLRCRTREALRAKGTYITGKTRALGCTNEELKSYIEKQFQPGMSWDNYGIGVGEWSLDHIKPLSKFDLTDREQLASAAHYTNIQPMWHTDNIKKGDKT